MEEEGMDAEQINAAVAERLGWNKITYPFFPAGIHRDVLYQRTEWEEGDDVGTLHPLDCFTTASAEWCEHVLKPVLEECHAVLKGPISDYVISWFEPPGSYRDVEDPDLYTAVALAWLQMGEGEAQ